MFRQYRKFQKNEYIVIGYDLAMGGKDFCGVQFLSQTYKDVPMVYHEREIGTQATNKIIPIIERIHDITGIRPMLAPERQNGGTLEIDRILAMNRMNKYEVYKMPTYARELAPTPVRFGWDTNSSTRPKMLADLKEAVDNRVIQIYDKQTIQEMFSFVIVQTTSSWKAQAESGAHDDLVMPLAIAWQLAMLCPPPQSLHNITYDFPQESLFKDGFY